MTDLLSPNVAVQFSSVSKSFGDFRANSEISFQVKQGSVHALVGENGAGKSTLMKILFGLLQPDSGEIFVKGKRIQWSSPAEARRAGLGMVHQHFQLAEAMTALDHLMLETSFSGGFLGILPRQKLKSELEKVAEQFHMPVPWDSLVRDLSVGLQQRLEIIKLLYCKADILIFDEPTAVLSPIEIEKFFQQIRALKQEGHSILLITHKLKEVLALADDVTVLRKGQCVHSSSLLGVTESQLAQWIVGRPPRKIQNTLKVSPGENLLSIQEMVTQKTYSDEGQTQNPLLKLSLQVHRGEIVGIAGVEGNGQSQLLQILMRPGLIQDSECSGNILYKGENILGRSLREFPIAYFPEDRLHQAIMDHENPVFNFLLGQHKEPHLNRHGILDWAKIRSLAENVMTAEKITPLNLQLPLSQFSGGNQQKFVIGRELWKKPDLVIAAHPTRGVDIGAIEHIHETLLELRAQGKGILLISSEIEELFSLADRILVFFEGQIAGELSRENFDEEKVGRWMIQGQKRPEVSS